MDVNEVLEIMRNECNRGNSRFNVVQSHIGITVDFAKESGLEKRSNDGSADPSNVPARLAAIFKFEREKGLKGVDLIKQLPITRYIGILVLEKLEA